MKFRIINEKIPRFDRETREWLYTDVWYLEAKKPWTRKWFSIRYINKRPEYFVADKDKEYYFEYPQVERHYNLIIKNRTTEMVKRTTKPEPKYTVVKEGSSN